MVISDFSLKLKRIFAISSNWFSVKNVFHILQKIELYHGSIERSVRMHPKLKTGENQKPVINLIRNKGYRSNTYHCTGTGDPLWPSVSV